MAKQSWAEWKEKADEVLPELQEQLKAALADDDLRPGVEAVAHLFHQHVGPLGWKMQCRALMEACGLKTNGNGDG